MPYFVNFPIVTVNGNRLINLTRAFRLRPDILARDELFYIYELDPGEKPEDVANQFYNDPTYHWIVLLSNQVLDPFYEWYMSGSEFNTYLLDKYGSGVNDIHHFIDSTTDEFVVIPAGDFYSVNYSADDYVEDIPVETSNPLFDHINASNLSSVTNLEFETQLNDARRNIRILKPEYIQSVIDDLESGEEFVGF